MTRDPHDDRLQDYLDGRLPDEERAEVEKHLERDADAAGRVTTAREIRAALGEDPDELSPGFYARTRAAFEKEHGDVRRHFGFRMLSWESFGLAAAVMLAVLIFLPPLLELGGRAPAELAAGDSDAAAFEDEATPPAAPETKSAPVAGGESRIAEARSKEEGRDKGQRKNEEWAPVPGKRSRRDGPTALPDDSAETEDSARSEALEESLDAEAPPAPALEQQSADPREKETHEADRYAKPTGLTSAGPATAIPEGLVVSGDIRAITDRAGWEAILAALDGPTRDRLGRPAPDRMLILIGPPAGGLDCSTLRTVETAGELAVWAGPVGRVDRGGCALVAARVDKPVVLRLEGRE